MSLERNGRTWVRAGANPPPRNPRPGGLKG